MKKWFIKHAIKSLFTTRNSEGPALGVSILGALMNFLPDDLATPEFKQSVMGATTPLAGYALARMYTKSRKGPDKE